MNLKAVLSILTAAGLLCGCKPAKKAGPVEWQYASLDFRESHTDYFGHKYVTQIAVLSRYGWETNNCYSLDEALGWVGSWGWDLAWSDGSNCIVKRPANDWTNGGFVVIQAPDTK